MVPQLAGIAVSQSLAGLFCQIPRSGFTAFESRSRTGALQLKSVFHALR